LAKCDCFERRGVTPTHWLLLATQHHTLPESVFRQIQIVRARVVRDGARREV